MKFSTALLAAAMGTLPAYPALAQNPYALPDNTYITINGKAVSADDDSFVLDYGGGTIEVELGGWDWFSSDNAEEKINPGDQVVVFGEVDDELFEATKIEAENVYIQELGTQFSPGSGTQQPPVQEPQFYAATWTFVDFDTVVEGTVTSVSQEQKQFSLKTGTTSTQTLVVDASNLENNPLDAEGYQQVKKGTRIAVSGNLDENFIESRKLIAENIVTLTQDKTKQSRSGSQAAGSRPSTSTQRQTLSMQPGTTQSQGQRSTSTQSSSM